MSKVAVSLGLNINVLLTIVAVVFLISTIVSVISFFVQNGNDNNSKSNMTSYMVKTFHLPVSANLYLYIIFEFVLMILMVICRVLDV